MAGISGIGGSVRTGCARVETFRPGAGLSELLRQRHLDLSVRELPFEWST